MYKVIGVDNQTYGPVDADLIRQWIRERRLAPHSQLQREGETEWRPLSAFAEFADVLATTTPPASTQRIYVPSGAAPGRTNGMAVGGFVCGLLSFCCCPASIVGLILSVMALSQIAKEPGQQGKGLAIAGIVLSLIGLISGGIFVALGSFGELLKEFGH